jgi:hypothetical protein
VERLEKRLRPGLGRSARRGGGCGRHEDVGSAPGTASCDDGRWRAVKRPLATRGGARVCASRAFGRARKGRVASFRLSIGTTKGFFFGFSGAFFCGGPLATLTAAPRHAHGEDYGTTASLRTRAS